MSSPSGRTRPEAKSPFSKPAVRRLVRIALIHAKLSSRVRCRSMIRRWVVVESGYEIVDLGRLRASIVEAYNAAH